MAYRQVVLMLDAGWSQAEIAGALGIEVGAVGPLIELAEAKLARICTDARNATAQPESSES
jgi:DNA-directed RNA polymerase specialized sigma24 family protein